MSVAAAGHFLTFTVCGEWIGFWKYTCSTLNLWQASHTCVTEGATHHLPCLSCFSFVLGGKILEKISQVDIDATLLGLPQLVFKNSLQLQEIKDGLRLWAAPSLTSFVLLSRALTLLRDSSPQSTDNLFSAH